MLYYFLILNINKSMSYKNLNVYFLFFENVMNSTQTIVYKLYLCPQSQELKDKYLQSLQTDINFSGNSGFDIYIPEDTFINPGETKVINHLIKTKMVKIDNDFTEIPVGYYIYSHSSICETPLTLPNHTSIIDINYRDNIKVAFTHNLNNDHLLYVMNNRNHIVYDDLLDQLNENMKHKIQKHTRLLKICSPTLQPFRVEIVDTLDINDIADNGLDITDL